jgi:hypothetical protein
MMQTNKNINKYAVLFQQFLGFLRTKKKSLIVYFQVIFLQTKKNFKVNSPSFYNKMIVSNNYWIDTEN